MPGDVRRLDEDDVRVRPGRGSRPRSKQRPEHGDAVEGMVLTVDRGRYAVLVGEVTVTAMRARELGRRGIAVGDRVGVVGDLSGRPDTLARIVRLHERETVLRRTADDTDPLERVIVANADQMVIVASLAEPPPSYGLIDRCLVACLTAGLEPLLCLTKSDLADPAEALQRYAQLDVPAVVTARGEVSRLRPRLVGHASVFVGHSGVGKSTLINALVPDAQRAVGVVSSIGKGQHTSSSAIAFRLPAGGSDGDGDDGDDSDGSGGGGSGGSDGGGSDGGGSDGSDGGGWVIDTPGVRSFGLAHVDADDLLWAFPDLEDGATQCPSGCEHQSAPAGCMLDAWVADGHSTADRLAAFRRLLASRSAELA